jgi:23S rRNA pseudouridine2605 synthase
MQKQPATKSASDPAELRQGERIAKRLARAGLCSRREAERWIADGRVAVNGKVIASAALNVGPADRIEVDGKPLPGRERTRLWLYHKPRGLVTTARDPEGRPTVFAALPKDMPRVMSIGRLDINTQGLLLLTNDGGLARILELPATGWLRRYRVRAHGAVTQAALDSLGEGVAVDGVLYGPIEAALERTKGENVWIAVALREGKNREIRKVFGSLGLDVSRLIRVSFGPFQLGDLGEGEAREIRGRMLRDQLGPRLIAQADADFDAPVVARKPGTEMPATQGEGRRNAANLPAGGKKRREPPADPLSRLSTRPPGPRPPGSRPGGKKAGKEARGHAGRRR